MVPAMSSVALQLKALNPGSKYRPWWIWAARVGSVVLLFSAIASGYIDGPDLQGHYRHPHDPRLYDGLFVMFLCAWVLKLEMEVWWLKRHPEAR